MVMISVKKGMEGKQLLPSGKQDRGKVFDEVGDADSGNQNRGGRTAAPAQRVVRNALRRHTHHSGEYRYQREGDIPGDHKEPNGIEGEVHAHHKQTSVGKIDETHNTVDHCISDSYQCVDTAQRDSIADLLQKNIE